MRACHSHTESMEDSLPMMISLATAQSQNCNGWASHRRYFRFGWGALGMCFEGSEAKCSQRLRGLIWCCWALFRQAALLLPWLICLVLMPWSHPSGLSLGLGLAVEQEMVLSLGAFLFLAATVAAALRVPWRDCRKGLREGEGLFAGHLDAGPLLALVALLLWQMGLWAPASDTEPWCLAVMKAAGQRDQFSHSADRHHAAVGLVLLDDMLRAVLRFVAGDPLEAWSFALTSRKMHSLWITDEEFATQFVRWTAWEESIRQSIAQSSCSCGLCKVQEHFAAADL
ncbi:unnamed protein product [Polarella glacialis]|uniref:Uncharacterized protein n=1 Tax=Polarella glacialis TaxID=89957 RepID=A0A813H9X0_POLGL|nr:unnamed protein product [Polarella glacialis]